MRWDDDHDDRNQNPRSFRPQSFDILQDGRRMEDRRPRQRQLGGKVAGDAGLLGRQQLNDGHPRRVSQGLGHAG